MSCKGKGGCGGCSKSAAVAVGPPLQFRADGEFTGLEVETCVIDDCTGSANICLTHHEALEGEVQRLHAELTAAEVGPPLQFSAPGEFDGVKDECSHDWKPPKGSRSPHPTCRRCYRIRSHELRDWEEQVLRSEIDRLNGELASLHDELVAAEEQSSLQRDRAKRAELEAERLRSISDEKSLRLIGFVSRIDLDKGQVSVTFDASEAVLRRLAPLMLRGSAVEASFPIEGEKTDAK